MLRKRKAWAAAALTGCLLMCAGATAQSALQAIGPGESVKGALIATTPSASDAASRYDCYVLRVTAGEPVELTLASASFSPKLSVGRGATCSGASFQFVKTGSAEARLVFKPAPGRYMVMVQAADGRLGGYTLTGGGQGATQMADAGGVSRREIMDAQVGKRRAEVAEEERRQAEAARHAEAARQAELERIRERDEEARIAREAQELEDAEEEAARPRVNPMQVFADTLNSEMQKNAQQRAQQQAFLDNLAAQQRAAQRARLEREAHAQRQAAERASEARQLAAADAAQRQAAAEALARQQREQQLAQARRTEQQRLVQQQVVQQRQQQLAQSQASIPQSRPAGGAPALGPARAGQASIRPDPMQCVTRPSVQRGSLCPNNTLNVSVVNGCPEPVTIKLCLKKTDGSWDCGRGTKNPQEAYSHPVCNATSETFVGVVYRDGGGPMPSPQ